MNKKAQKSVFGFALVLLVFLFLITAFVTITPMKEFLDSARNSTSLNCPGTQSFNQTDWDDDSKIEKLTRRPTCFATGFTLVYFIGAFIIATFVWLTVNWRKLK